MATSQVSSGHQPASLKILVSLRLIITTSEPSMAYKNSSNTYFSSYFIVRQQFSARDGPRESFQVIFSQPHPSCRVMRKPSSALNKPATLDPHALHQWLSTGGNSGPWGHTAMSKDIVGCYSWGDGCSWQPVNRNQVSDSPSNNAQARPHSTVLSWSKGQWCQARETLINDCPQGRGNPTPEDSVPK